MFQICPAVPKQGGRGWGCGGVVEVEGRVVWGGAGLRGEVYRFDEIRSEWVILTGVVWGATLAVCGGKLVSVGGYKFGVGYRKEVKVLRGGRWTSMTKMLVGCRWSCVISVSGGVLLGDGGLLNDIQIFDGRTWHKGPPLPRPCEAMSAVVHGDLVFAMGGYGMERAVWSANITDLVSH